jgi:hypothetical protein
MTTFLLTHSGSTSGQPKVLETLNADPNWSSPTNERQRRRLEVLQWKSADCNGVQIDPKSARPPLPSPFPTSRHPFTFGLCHRPQVQ